MTFENLLDTGFEVQIYQLAVYSNIDTSDNQAYRMHQIDIITNPIKYTCISTMYEIPYNTCFQIQNIIMMHALLNLKKPVHFNLLLSLLNENIDYYDWTPFISLPDFRKRFGFTFIKKEKRIN